MLHHFQKEAAEGRRVDIGALDDLGVYLELWLPEYTEEFAELTDHVLLMAITFNCWRGGVLEAEDLPLPPMPTAQPAVASNQ